MDNNSMLKLCRLCLVKDEVNIPIFEEQGDIRQIFLKISSCLPVKVSRDDQLPKKICDGCSYKLDMLYEFWNTSANAEKQLLTWLGEAGMSSQMADGTISAVAQQIKPADAFVKQETIDPPDIHMDDDDDDEEDKDYNMKQEEHSNNVEEPPPKRARRTAAVKAAIALDQNSDDDDDSGEPMTKVEDDSEDSDNDDHEPAFVDVPSTSADDQPGPSGVGKDGVEAPNGPLMKNILVPFTTSATAPKSWLLLKVPVQANDESMLRRTTNPTQIQMRMADNQQQPRISTTTNNQSNLIPAPMMILNNAPFGVPTFPPLVTFPRILQTQLQPGMFNSVEFRPTAALNPLLTVVNSPTNILQTQLLKDKQTVNVNVSKSATVLPPLITFPRLLQTQPRMFNTPIVQFRPTTRINSPSNILTAQLSTKHKQTVTSTMPVNVNAWKSANKNVPAIQQHTYVNPFNYSEIDNSKAIVVRRKKIIKEKIKKPVTWMCLLCSEKKEDKEALLEHYAYHKQQREELEQQEDALENQSCVKCPVCSRTFTDVRSYRLHIYAFHKPREFYCHLCKMGFSSTVHLSKHNIRHAPDKQTIVCSKCKKYSTKSMIMLIEHVNKRHRQTVYHCDYCKKQFYSKTWFKDHKQFHLKHSAFNCKHCGKLFDNRRSLNRHMKQTHADSLKLKKYKCDACVMTFPFAENLQKHMENIHTKSALLCTTCGKEFTNESSMRRHMILHTNNKKTCNICEKSFGSNYSLNQHMVIHTGKRPYKCHICEKSFTQPSPLKIHIRLHTGERPYTCSLCKRGFTSKSSKDCHEKTCNSKKKVKSNSKKQK